MTLVLLLLLGTLAAQGGLPRPTTPASRAESLQAVATLEGFVLGPDGSPVAGALVVSSAGGSGTTDARGRYRLDLAHAHGATEVQVTAVGGQGGNQLAHASVALSGTGAAVLVAPLVLGGWVGCDPRWLPTFGREPGTNFDVLALAVHDDGTGPALYVGGEFTSVGGIAAAGIARWNGRRWSAVGGGVSGSVSPDAKVGVHVLLVHDDGSGPVLYAGGHFVQAGGLTVNHIARWNGATWSALGTGVSGIVRALVVHDDGGGEALYVGGAFLMAGGVNALRVARWNGTSWSSLGQFGNPVRALAVYDDGGGPKLYAGGEFSSIGALTARRIARWDGASWSALGNGVNGQVTALAVHDDGSGSALYVGGAFTTADGAPANRIARWSGAWSPVGSGMDGTISALSVHDDDGGGAVLVAGGSFTSAGGAAANAIARWDGASWSALGPGLASSSSNPSVRALASFDDGSGAQLFAGGSLRGAGSLAVNRIACWDGADWSALGHGLNDTVRALLVHDDGSGPALYAGGAFTDLGGVPANHVARWDGAGWTALGSGMGTDGSIPAAELYVSALAVHDDGTGPALYAGGSFATAGGVPASRIARWNGTSWSALGSGTDLAVEALASFDDGGGAALHAGGAFMLAGGVAASRIAKWNGASWSALGAGMSGTAPLGVACLRVHDDGGGPALYAGGHFERADNLLVNHLARWNGASWSAVGGGMTGTNSPEVTAMLSLASGGPPQLYATGVFTRAGGLIAVGIARWNGASWAALGTFPFFGRALAVYDDGSGARIHAAAEYAVGGVAHAGIARWTGASWQLLGGDLLSRAFDLAVFDDGHGPALFAAAGALDSADSYLALWGDPDRTAPVLACPESVWVLDPYGSPSGETVSFRVKATDDCTARPDVVCVPPSGSVFPHGTTLVTCTATDASGNQTTCQFPVTVALKVRRR